VSGSPSAPWLVLLVDDAEDVHMLVNRAVRRLTRADIELVSARDGVEALDVLRACGERVALVLSDVNMPKMSGVGLLNAARALGYTGHFSLMGALPDGVEQHAGAESVEVVDKETLLSRLPALIARVPAGA